MSVARKKTSAEICLIFSINQSTLNRWIKLGLPYEKGIGGKGNLYSESEAAAWMAANKITGKVGRPAGPSSEALMKLKIEKEAELVRRYRRENEIQDGKLHDVAVCEKSITGAIINCRNRFLAMGATLSPQLDGLTTGERQTLIEQSIESVLKELSGRP